MCHSTVRFHGQCVTQRFVSKANVSLNGSFPWLPHPVRYLVEDGDHVDADTAFAEIEVMKMVMPLIVSHSGIMRLSLQAGAVMAAGDVVANLLLDDPSKVWYM
jgi:biotin carboxyl carrier protein